MDEKSSLINQLRIDRTQPPNGRGGIRLWAFLGGAIVLIGAGAAWFVLAGPNGVPVHAGVARAASSGGIAAGGSLLDASGYVVARRQATVSAKIAGKLIDVLIEEGQHVDKDQIIAKLDDSNLLAALEQARAQVRQAEAGLSAAKTAFADAKPIYLRNKKLAAAGWISATAFDSSKAAYDAAETNLAVADEQLTVARKFLIVCERNEDDATVRAPFTGVVTVKAAQPGEIVSPISAGGGGFTRTGIATIVDMDSLEVEVDVSENFINRVHSGQPATIKLNAYPDWQIPADVIAVIPTADRSKATVKVRVGFKEKDQRLVPEMGARVSFLSDAPTHAAGAPPASPGVIVPVEAVQANGDTGIIFVINDDIVERRTVRLGARNEDGQTILSGVASGAHLAIGDFSKLTDGAKVHVEQ